LPQAAPAVRRPKRKAWISGRKRKWTTDPTGRTDASEAEDTLQTAQAVELHQRFWHLKPNS